MKQTTHTIYTFYLRLTLCQEELMNTSHLENPRLVKWAHNFTLVVRHHYNLTTPPKNLHSPQPDYIVLLGRKNYYWISWLLPGLCAYLCEAGTHHLLISHNLNWIEYVFIREFQLFHAILASVPGPGRVLPAIFCLFHMVYSIKSVQYSTKALILNIPWNNWNFLLVATEIINKGTQHDTH